MFVQIINIYLGFSFNMHRDCINLLFFGAGVVP